MRPLAFSPNKNTPKLQISPAGLLPQKSNTTAAIESIRKAEKSYIRPGGRYFPEIGAERV
jgi:hypothetical protein